MAFLPCDRGHPNPRGRNHLVYSAYGSGGNDFTRFRLRLCAIHADEVYGELSSFVVTADDDTVSEIGKPTVCIACRKEVEQNGWQVFATAYPSPDSRVDYWAALHHDCRFPEWLVNTGDNGHIAREKGDKRDPKQG